MNKEFVFSEIVNSEPIEIVVSLIYGSNRRIVQRAGDASTDWMTIYRSTTNCESFCASVMQFGGATEAGAPNTYGGHPYYAKCFNWSSATPSNGVRVAFTSQIGTTDIDPSIPQMFPVTNVSACLSILILLFLNSIWKFRS